MRAHIFNNLINTIGTSSDSRSSFTISPETDQRLAEKARLYLQDQIPMLYQWFRRESVDAILDENIRCTRAEEPPQMKRAAFGINLPICKRGKNKHCHVEDFIREHAVALSASLCQVDDRSLQIDKAISLFEQVRDDPEIDVSHSHCRSAGDCLIALEAKGHATHALSTNVAEWELLSSQLKMEFVRVEYPEERRR